MNAGNPYLRDRNRLNTGSPLLLKAPLYDFDSAEKAESELLPEELCIARIPNTKPHGFTHHVALLYKDEYGDVYSVGMAQHNGEIKDGTLEVIKKQEEEEETKDPLPDLKGDQNGSNQQEVHSVWSKIKIFSKK